MSSNAANASARRFQLRSFKVEDGIVVKCSGRLTSEFASTLKTEMKALLPQARRIVLDLSQVAHMDSSGLGSLVSVYVSAKTAGCELQLVNLGARIQELFRITNMLSVFGKCGEYHIRFP